MKIRIFQINSDRDTERILFESLKNTPQINPDIYDEVFRGEVACKDLEDVYSLFNHGGPHGYRGRSLSMSDIVEVQGGCLELVGKIRYYNTPKLYEELNYTDSEKYNGDIYEAQEVGRTIEAIYLADKHIPSVENGFWFCDLSGFTKVDFVPEAVLPLAPGAEDDKMFYRNEEAGSLSIGYLRGNFGSRGDEFFHSWFENDSGRKTPEFQTEFQSVMTKLRQGVLKDHASMVSLCNAYPEARLPGAGERYGFKLETEERQYFVRCTKLQNDYFYVFPYDKAEPVVLKNEEALMNEQEFAGWKSLTESSRHHWMEDDIFRLNGRGAFYFIGGEDGIYMRIEKEGRLEAGTYKGAIPHIGEAMFRVVSEKQYDNYSDAFAAARNIGGKQFLADMFSGHKDEAIRAAKLAYDKAAEAKPSVLEQIRKAKKNPQPHKPKAERGKEKSGPEL